VQAALGRPAPAPAAQPGPRIRDAASRDAPQIQARLSSFPSPPAPQRRALAPTAQPFSKSRVLFKNYFAIHSNIVKKIPTLNAVNNQLQRKKIELGSAERIETDKTDEDWHVHFKNGPAIYLKTKQPKHGKLDLNKEDTAVLDALHEKWEEQMEE
jgi:hypothetical protein